MFAKLTLSFVDETTGEVDHAWSAAYLFTGIFIVSIILLLFLGLRERNTDVLRPVIILRGDYCVVWKVDKLFVDPGATALDLQQEGGKENILTHLIKINIAFQSKERDELVRIDNNGLASDSFVMPAYLDPKYKVAKLMNWIPNKVGMYVITYFAADEKGNVGKASRTVIVGPNTRNEPENMVVPPSSPPPRLRVHERKVSNRKTTMLDVDLDLRKWPNQVREGGKRGKVPSLDFDDAAMSDSGRDSFANLAGPMESEERASKIYKIKQSSEGEEAFSLSNLSTRTASEASDSEDGEHEHPLLHEIEET
mmetsp:Transcript_15214/g.38609  ORF Transcript_15214/g.38609 Transcript_15214/m.38609 type:complete len:309 (-) Transcript_15214:239-1165(-)